MLRLLALLLAPPVSASPLVALALALLAGTLAGCAWGALTRRSGFTPRERFASALVPAVAARALLSARVVLPFDAVWHAEVPIASAELWRFSALGGLTVACGAVAGVCLSGWRSGPGEQPAATARDYSWLLSGLLVGSALQNFALYERFLRAYGAFRCEALAAALKHCAWAVLPGRPWPSPGVFQLEVVRQALWPWPPSSFTRPAAFVPLPATQARMLEPFGAVLAFVLVLTLFLVATHAHSVSSGLRRRVARVLGGTLCFALVFAAVVLVRSRAAALADPSTALPTSDFRWLVLIAAASVTSAGCLGAFLGAPWGKGARLACAFCMLSALIVLRLALDHAVLPDPDLRPAVDVLGARVGVERYLSGGCALLLALGFFPRQPWRSLKFGANAAGQTLVVCAALVLFARSLAFARDARVRFTRQQVFYPGLAQVSVCRGTYPWGRPSLDVLAATPPWSYPLSSIATDRRRFESLRDELRLRFRALEELPPDAEPKARERVLGIVTSLDASAQDARCALVAASDARAAVVVPAERLERVETATLGPVTRVAERCAAGRLELTEAASGLPVEPGWTLRELLEHARERPVNPRLDPDSLPVGCR